MVQVEIANVVICRRSFKIFLIFQCKNSTWYFIKGPFLNSAKMACVHKAQARAWKFTSAENQTLCPPETAGLKGLERKGMVTVYLEEERVFINGDNYMAIF